MDIMESMDKKNPAIECHGGKKALFLLKNLELLNRSPDVGGPCG
jgi:hypothetical protein